MVDDGFGLDEEYDPNVPSFVDFIQDCIGAQLVHIGLMKLTFLEQSSVSEANGNLKAASGNFHAFGGTLAWTDNTCGHVTSKNLSRWNQDRSLNLHFWSSHQQFRTYYYGSTHTILDLGLRDIPSLVDGGERTATDANLQRLQVLGTTCEGGAFVRLHSLV